jgi:uncharacterized protein YegL
MTTGERTRTLLFVVDTAGDMRDELIIAANNAIKNTISELKNVSTKRNDVTLRIASLTFYSDSDPTLLLPEDIAEYSWKDLKWSGKFGARISLALKKLNNEGDFFSDIHINDLPPTIIFIVNSTLDDDYKDVLRNLKNKQKFKSAFKAAIILGDGIDVNEMALITESKKRIAVVGTDDQLAEKIREMSLDGIFHEQEDIEGAKLLK